MGKLRLVYTYPWQEEIEVVTTFSDANWASNACDRKSTSGGVIMHGTHCTKPWSKTQSLVALSSEESELHAIAKTSSEVLGFQSTVQDLDKVPGARPRKTQARRLQLFDHPIAQCE